MARGRAVTTVQIRITTCWWCFRKRTPKPIDQLYRAVQEVELETLRAISLLIRTREQYETARRQGERVLRDAEEEGYLL